MPRFSVHGWLRVNYEWRKVGIQRLNLEDKSRLNSFVPMSFDELEEGLRGGRKRFEQVAIESKIASIQTRCHSWRQINAWVEGQGIARKNALKAKC
jgi:hypothetical protein